MKKLVPLFFIFLLFGCISSDVRIKQKVYRNESTELFFYLNNTFPTEGIMVDLTSTTSNNGLFTNFTVNQSRNNVVFHRMMNKTEFITFLDKLKINFSEIKIEWVFPYIHYSLNVSVDNFLNASNNTLNSLFYEIEVFGEVYETNGNKLTDNSVEFDLKKLKYMYINFREPIFNVIPNFNYFMPLLVFTLISIIVLIKFKFTK